MPARNCQNNAVLAGAWKLMGIKENWLRQDELCPNCGKVTQQAKGITKGNMKKLFTPQFNMNEAIWTIVIIGVLLLAYLYSAETKQCRDWAKELRDNPKETCDLLLQNKSIGGVMAYNSNSEFGAAAKAVNLSSLTNELNPES